MERSRFKQETPSGETGRNRRAHERVAFVARTTATQMNEYRAFTVGHDGHFTASRAFVCASDEDAVVWAKQLIDGYDVELWSGDRLVIKLDHQEK